MERWRELLGHEEITGFLATHQGATEKVERAAKNLGGTPADLKALVKILPVLDSGIVQVFFSYKKKDEEAAKAIVNLLKLYSAERLRFTYMASFTEELAGKKYRDTIREAICNANLFMLLLPDPADDWDWCLYETGIFEAHGTAADRLICIYHPDATIPNQIEDYQGVCANHQNLMDFLRMLFVKPDLVPGLAPVNRAVEYGIEELARNINAVLRPPRKLVHRQFFQPWIELKVADGSVLDSEADFDRASIVSCNKEALDMFGFITMPQNWGVLRSVVSGIEMDSRWRKELFDAIRMISCGLKFAPVQAVFRTKTGSIYRPYTCAVDRLGGEQGAIERYHITFIDEVSAIDSSSMPNGMAELATLLRFSFRFRWELLEVFTKPINQEDVERMESTFSRILADWASRGVGERSDILRLFPEEEAAQIIQMFKSYDTLRNDEGTGELDVAIKNRDAEKVPALLAKILPMNQRFLEMITERFLGLISQETVPPTRSQTKPIGRTGPDRKHRDKAA